METYEKSREEKPQNTRTTQKKTACGEETTKYTKYTKKALRTGLPAWEESTENTDHTEKDCMWEIRDGGAEERWRGDAAASLSVVPQGALSPCIFFTPPQRAPRAFSPFFKEKNSLFQRKE